ncbi:MAG: hypothetical protein A4S09_08960 [Proteobacteria bacterium SG_bin7]|nr:MAG: hypothetical protein A4S09_08960 [Proteobacteria bacterium SG_bin7]
MSHIFVFVTGLLLVFSVHADQNLCTYTPSEVASKPKQEKYPNLRTENLSASQVYTQKLYIRMTGVTPNIGNLKFGRMVKLVQQNKIDDALKMMMAEDGFLQVRIRNFAAPFSSKDYSTLEPLNDLQALIIGIIRDDLDARLILTGDIRYSGTEKYGLPEISMKNNDHYVAFESANLSFSSDLKKYDQQWPNFDEAAGALTTRAWAKINFDMGTNRRNVPNSFNVFLCSHIDSWKTRGVPDVYVRRDVTRNNAGDPAVYQNFCRNCHGLMDGMGGAFAKFDFTDGSIQFKKNGVMEKMNQHAEVYPEGYVTTDDSWENMLHYNPSISFGWRSPMKGQGIKQFAEMLAQSKAYSQCLVKKVYQEICGTSILETAPELLEPLRTKFESNGYKIRSLISNIAVERQCISPEGVL